MRCGGFFAANDNSIDYFIVRDADARLNSQDRVAVDEWIKWGSPSHHAGSTVHAELIMGIMGRKSLFYYQTLLMLLIILPVKNKIFIDQIFLAEFVAFNKGTKVLCMMNFFNLG